MRVDSEGERELRVSDRVAELERLVDIGRDKNKKNVYLGSVFLFPYMGWLDPSGNVE